MSTEQTPPEAGRALKIAEQAHELALSIDIDSAEMYAMAAGELQSIKARAKQIDELRFSLTRPLDLAKQRIMDLFRVPSARLEEAETLLKGNMLAFKRAEDERIAAERREAQRKADEERAELRRQQQAAEAEQRRLQEEQAAIERKAQEEAAALRKAGDEAAARAAEEAAAQAREQAEIAALAAAEAAADVQQQIDLADVAPVALPVVAAAKADGVSSRQNWKFEITSLADLVRAAAADPQLLAFLQPETKALGQAAKALKGQARIPGVRVYAEESLAVRAA